MATSTPPIILFTYPESVAGRRTEWYLAIRGIPYHICEVDNKMPRRVLDRLDVHYRRIPIMAIGRDIYCDSRCIIDHLERLYTELPKLGSDKPYEKGVERVLESWVLDGPPFRRTAMMIAPDASLAQDPAWLADRAELTGIQFSGEGLKEGLQDALSHARQHLRIVEEELMGDGRHWLSGRDYPGLADVHVLWVFDWMMRPRDEMGMMHAYPDLLNAENYPKTFAWVGRMQELFRSKQRRAPSKRISDDEAVKVIEGAAYFESDNLTVDASDPAALQKGAHVDLVTLDAAPACGSSRRDVGKLEGLEVTSVTISTKTKNGVDVRIHYQRANVRVARASHQARLAASEIPEK